MATPIHIIFFLLAGLFGILFMIFVYYLYNEKLTIWTTLLGDFNEHGLRQYPPIKLRNKRPDPMLFHMRY